MNTKELYDYIDERIERLSMDEKTNLYAGKDDKAFNCLHRKNELLYLKEFIKTNERKLKS